MRGLYAIVDVTTLERAGIGVIAAAEALLDARPACLQLRAKEISPSRTLELLRAIRPLARRASVPFFANDRPDLALLSECDGVHVGQDDLSPIDVRAIAESTRRGLVRQRLAVGLSTHNADQVDAALDSPIDYLAIGPIFGTASKVRPDPTVGIAGLSALAATARAKRPELPLVAIGGLTRSRITELSGLVDMVAVIAALVHLEPMPKEAALDHMRRNAAEIASLFQTEERK